MVAVPPARVGFRMSTSWEGQRFGEGGARGESRLEVGV